MGILDSLNLNKEKIKVAKENIKKVYFMNDLPWVIGYSGGKDSTCTTQIIIETLIELKNKGTSLKKHVYIISSDTLVENPMIVGTIHKTIAAINDVAIRENLPISAHVIKPDFNNTFWANLIGRGYPSPNQTFRWCTDRMKINPANQFITSIVDKYGEAIMVLGVRDGESESRDRVLESHTIEGRLLMRHTTMANAYVFAPIRHFNIEDVWDYLLSNPSPWGANNVELYDMYKESAEDCPLIIDKETKQHATCGNSRFGCWVCTVVSKDKSLTSFINKGENWLLPLLDFRNWIYSIRDDETMRMRR
jgi:DNA sulfur modification protein DndC